ncbi:PREDICTED: midasin [Nicrophorus vespilloides]|uniref:Midasin n=1 Tax=Nicrophorus vespilloides TaxID=110193 RepID=A0ABM1NC34_NICVS|nr:PREDICTED: midasin [Nicrophorus vespilloides]
MSEHKMTLYTISEENLLRFSAKNKEFEKFLTNYDAKDLKAGHVQDIFEYIAAAFLDPRYTASVVECFRRHFVKILHLAISVEQGEADRYITIRNTVALAKTIELHPDSESFILKYFEKWTDLFTEDAQSAPKKKKRDVAVYAFSDLDFVEACYKLLKFKPAFFKGKWNWSTFFAKYANHKDAAVRWIYCHCVGLYTGMGEIQLNNYLDIVLKSSERIDSDLKYGLSRQIAISDIQNADSDMHGIITSESVICVCGIYLPVYEKVVATCGKIVEVASTRNNLQRIALGIAANKTVSLLGPVGSGKTCLVEYLAAKTGRVLGKSFIKIQLGDQTDSKMLLGTYKCTDVPGEFIWQPGVLTQAVIDGSWLLLEDIDSASVDIASVLNGLIENGYLTVPGYHDSVPIKPGFQLFLTQRLITTITGHHRKYTNANALLEKHVLTINIDPLIDSELIEIISGIYPQLKTICTRMSDVFKTVSGDAERLQKNARLTSTRDLFKWTSRAVIDFDIASQASALRVLQDAIDIFCCAFPNADERVTLAQAISAHLGIVEQKAQYFLNQYKPNLSMGDNDLKVGRALIKRQFNIKSNKVLNYCFTRPFACLLERIICCVNLREPVLLVGETGTGKTSAVQYLAHTVGQKLLVINMNQQSDSADLLGGYKPVDFKFIIAPVKKQFEAVFKGYFNADANRKFLQNLNYCYNEKLWSHLITLMKKSYEAAMNRLVKNDVGQKRVRSESSEKEIKYMKQWTEVGSKLEKIEVQLKHKTALAFAFIEGTLVKAVTNGYWVLLDEINLANAETLECLSGLLEGAEGSLNLLENGEKKPIKRHPNFTLFACMNPSTDVGKKDLPVGLRNRFTEFFVDELIDRNDLILMVNSYLEAQSIGPEKVENIVKFYLNVRKESLLSLSDGLGHKPHFSLRSLCRALAVASKNPCGVFTRSLYEAFCLSFLTQLDANSYKAVEKMIVKYIIGGQKDLKAILKGPIREPSVGNYLQFEGYWVLKGSLEPTVADDYILTDSVRNNLKDLVRIVSIGHLPVLLQGDTSVGKTSLITYLAKASGYKCVRINNHEHTDLQEYIGSYVANEDGKLEFQEGCLVEAMRKGHWIILDELNLAPTDVLEALNRVLDDNRELFIPETQEVIKAHPNFMLFATQNPPGTYSGRKMLSRAFRNRFVELHFNEIPHPELEFILHKRCHMAPSYAKKMINVMKDLQTRRRGSAAFAGKHGFITLRDLFRWGERYRLAANSNALYDWDQHIADEGYLLLAGRVRKGEEREEIAEVIKKHIKREVVPQHLFTLSDKTSSITRPILEKIYENRDSCGNVVWTYNMRQLAVLVFKGIAFKEPILLVGETGGGKTTVCKLIADIIGQDLITVNCHMHIESSDFIGGLRPVREHSDDNLNKLFEWVDGPLIHAMSKGHLFLADEISLADDSVLERMNSLLEPERSLLLAEKANSKESELIVADARFSFVGTMNPGGDFGKKELSPALRNRFTEIWCEPCSNRQDLIDIVKHNLCATVSSQGVANNIIDFVDWFKLQEIGKRFTISIRDILTWVDFINACVEKIDPATAYFNGACLTFLDSFGSGVTSMEAESVLQEFKNECVNFIKNQLKESTINVASDNLKVEMIGDIFGIKPFYIHLGKEKADSVGFVFDAPTTVYNTLRLMRGMQLKKAILLEGSPGVGKTSLVTALAKATRNKVFRVNLSDQTDISDLFGADLPVEDGQAGQFAWRDGPLLQALKQGHWILLDELNLASQSVLEGLNACLDHRGEIFIPELGKTFNVKMGTRFFGCQNPLKQGGSRRGLPQSFLNRFTEVYVNPLNASDMHCILRSQFPGLPKDLLERMIKFNMALMSELEKHTFGCKGAPWEFNLRDLTRWCEATIYQRGENGGDDCRPENLVMLIYADRMRTLEDKIKICELFEAVFGVSIAGTNAVAYITKESAIFGDVRVSRVEDEHSANSAEDHGLVLRSQMSVLRSLGYCVNMNWMSILVGTAGCGKSSVVRTLAKLAGKALRVLPVTSAMDTTDILGGFEQTDYTRHLEELGHHVEAIHLRAVRQMFASGSEKEAIQCLRMWEKYTALKTEVKNSTMREEAENCVQKLKQLEAILSELGGVDGADVELIGRLLKTGCAIRANVERHESLNAGGKFEWVDSVLIKCLQEGTWLLVDNVNLCSSAVLDRLNGLLEPNGVLIVGERGMDKDGKMICIRPHPDFRLFLTMDPKNGEISRAMRNRGIEIYILSDAEKEDRNETDIKSLIAQQGLRQPYCIEALLQIHDEITSNVIGEKPNLGQLSQASFLISQKLSRGANVSGAFTSVIGDVYSNCRPEMSAEKVREILNSVHATGTLNLGDTLSTAKLQINCDLARIEQQISTVSANGSNFAFMHFFTISSMRDANLRLEYVARILSDEKFKTLATRFFRELQKRWSNDKLLPIDANWLPDTYYNDRNATRTNKLFVLFYYLTCTGLQEFEPERIRSKTLKTFTLQEYLLGVKRKQIENKIDDAVIMNVLSLLQKFDDFIAQLLIRDFQLDNETTIEVISLLQYRFVLYRFFVNTNTCMSELRNDEKILNNLHVHYKWFIKNSIKNLEKLIAIQAVDESLTLLIRTINAALVNHFSALQKLGKKYQKSLTKPPPLINELQTKILPEFHAALTKLDYYNKSNDFHKALSLLHTPEVKNAALDMKLFFDYGFSEIPAIYEQFSKMTFKAIEIKPTEIAAFPVLDHFNFLEILKFRLEDENSGDISGVCVPINTIATIQKYIKTNDKRMLSDVKTEISNYFRHAASLNPSTFLKSELNTTLHAHNAVLSFLIGDLMAGAETSSTTAVTRLGSYRDNHAMHLKIRSAIWSNFRQISSAEYDFTQCEKKYLMKSYEEFRRTFSEIFEGNSMDFNQILEGIESVFSQFEDRNNEKGVLISLLAALQEQIGLLESDSINVFANVYIILSYLKALLNSRLPLIDPLAKIEMRERYCGEEIQHLSELNDSFLVQSRLYSDTKFGLSPYCDVLKRKIGDLEVKRENLSKYVAVRPEDVDYQNVRRMVGQAFSTVLSPSTIFDIYKFNNQIEELIRDANGVDIKSIDTNVRLWSSLVASFDSFVKRLNSFRYTFPDIVAPLLADVMELVHGMNLKIGLIKKHLLRYDQSKTYNISLQSELLELVKIPNVQNLDVVNAYNGDKLRDFVEKTLAHSDKANGKLENFKMLKCGIMELSNACKLHSQFTRTLDENLFERFDKLLRMFVAAWKKQEEDTAAKKEAEESLYKTKTKCDENEDEIDEKEFKRLFPSYHDRDFAEFGEKMLGDDDDDDHDDTVKIDSKFSEVIRLEDLYFVSDLHSHMMTLFTRTEWLNPNCHKDDYKCDTIEPILIKFKLFKTLLDQSPESFDYTLDAELMGTLNVVAAIAQNYGDSSSLDDEYSGKSKKYDFYKDPNVEEVEPAYVILLNLQKKVNELLAEWPEHPTLSTVIDLIERIFNFDITSPLSRFLTGFDILLTKCHEWEENAHSGVSLSEHSQAISHQMIAWRKLEINNWKNSLDNTYERLIECMPKYWSYIYDVMNEFIEKKLFATDELISTLQKFILQSNVAEFKTRLEMLNVFHCHATYLPKTEERDIFISVMWNLFKYYEQFLPNVTSQMKSDRAPLEKKLKDYVKIIRWKDISYWALKDTLEKTHKNIYKFMKEYILLLSKPASPFLKNVTSQQEFVGVQDRPQRTSPKRYHYTSDSNSYITKLQLNIGECKSEVGLLACGDRYLKKLKSLSQKIISATQYPQNVKKLDCFVSEVIATSEHLQKLEIDTNLTKEKQKSQAKGYLQQKQRALVDLFKTLSKIGLSYRKGLMEEKCKDITAEYVTKPLDLEAALSHVPKCKNDEKLLILWDGVEVYFRKCLMRMEILDGAVKTPAKDLGMGNVERCKGYSGHLMTLALAQKRKLIESTNLLYHIRYYQMIFGEFQEHSTYINSEDLDKLKYLLFDTVVAMKQLKLILMSCPDSEPSKIIPVLESNTAFIQTKDDLIWNSTMKLVASTLTKSEQILEALRKVKLTIPCVDRNLVTPKFVHLPNSTQIIDDLKLTMENLEAIKSIFGSVPSIETVTILLKQYSAMAEVLCAKPAEDNCKEDLNEFKKDTEGIVKTVLLITQIIHKRYPENNEEVKGEEEEDQDVLSDNLLSVSLVQQIFDDISVLNMADIYLQVNSLACKLAALDYSKISDEFKREIAKMAPFFEQIVFLYQYFITQQVSTYRVTLKVSSILLNIFIELATNGFCIPPELAEEEKGEGDGKSSSGMGLGDGKGEKDVSDRIESEDQLEDAQPAGQEQQKEDDEDCKEEEKGIEMTDDFEGTLQDKEEKPGDEEDDDNKSKSDDGEEQMGDVDNDADQLDKEIWGSDDEEDVDEQGDGKDELKGDKGETEGEQELAAKENNVGNEEEEKNGDDKKEKEKEKKELNEMDDVEYDDDQVDPNHGNQPEYPEPEALDLPDDLNLDGEDNEDEKNEENPFDIDAIKDQMPEDKQSDEPEDAPTQEEEKKEDEMENDSDEEGGENKDDAKMDTGEENEEEENEDAKKGKKEIEEAVEEEPQGEDEDMEALDDPSTAENEISAPETSTAQSSVQTNPSTEDQSKKSNDEDNSQDDNPEKAGTGQAQMEESKSGHKGESYAQQTSKSKEEVSKPQNKRNKSGEEDTERSMGDTSEPLHKKMKTIDVQDGKEDENEEMEGETESEIYQHIKDPKNATDQMLDSVSKEQTDKQKDVPNEEKQGDEEKPSEDTEMLPENEQEEDVEMVDVDKLKPESLDKNESKKKSKDKLQPKDGESEDITDVEIDGENVDTMKVRRGGESEHFTQMSSTQDTSIPRLSLENITQLRTEIEQQLSVWHEPPTSGEAQKTWKKISSVTLSLAQSLSEQLRLVLEPTQSSHLKGDYRTGKRINMRKVIPYIASQFRKDKIWLRRTKPSKRDYQIVLAIDDSSSMADNHSKELAFESVSLISKALSLLESGQLSILSFGEDTEVLHKLSDQFTDDSGSKLLQKFQFGQKKTCVAKMVDFATEMLNGSSATFVDSLLAKLLIVMSDGRGIFSEGESFVQQAVRRAKLSNIFIIFVIIDNPENTTSILDIRKPIFQDGKIKEIKAYMDTFPFPFYIILRDINSLPNVLSDALRQWFELVSNVDKQ